MSDFILKMSVFILKMSDSVLKTACFTQRLGMNQIDILVIHDVDKMHFPEPGIAHHMGQLYSSGAGSGEYNVA